MAVKWLDEPEAHDYDAAAAYLSNELPETDSGAEFLTWFHDWMGAYLDEKGLTFQDIRNGKRLRLGVGSLSRRSSLG